MLNTTSPAGAVIVIGPLVLIKLSEITYCADTLPPTVTSAVVVKLSLDILPAAILPFTVNTFPEYVKSTDVSIAPAASTNNTEVGFSSGKYMLSSGSSTMLPLVVVVILRLPASFVSNGVSTCVSATNVSLVVTPVTLTVLAFKMSRSKLPDI